MPYKVKGGVLLWMTPPLEKILSVVEPIYSSIGLPLVITSGMEGVHQKEESLHYCGRAIDIRTHFTDAIDRKTWETVHRMVLERLADIFSAKNYPVDIVLEPDHLHIEWDERKATK